MNSWFTVKVKYTKQLEDGTFKRVSEPYLLAAMTFTDAEARIYEELGSLIRGEFMVNGIARTDIHDIFHYEDSDVWHKLTIVYESGDADEEGKKAKKVKQHFLVSAHSVKDAYDRLRESLGGLMIDFTITTSSISNIVDIFPFDATPQQMKDHDNRDFKLAFGLVKERFEHWVKDNGMNPADATSTDFHNFWEEQDTEPKSDNKTVFSASGSDVDDLELEDDEDDGYQTTAESEGGAPRSGPDMDD